MTNVNDSETKNKTLDEKLEGPECKIHGQSKTTSYEMVLWHTNDGFPGQIVYVDVEQRMGSCGPISLIRGSGSTVGHSRDVKIYESLGLWRNSLIGHYTVQFSDYIRIKKELPDDVLSKLAESNLPDEIKKDLGIEKNEIFGIKNYHPLTHQWDIVSGNTFAQGVHNLKKACEEDPKSRQPMFETSDGDLIPRPLTLAETCLLKVTKQKNTFDSSLTFRFTDTCDVFAYKGGSTKFLYVPEYEGLITLDKKDPILIDYEKFKKQVEGFEFDSGDDPFAGGLKSEEAHKFWLTVFRGDVKQLGHVERSTKEASNEECWYDSSRRPYVMGVYPLRSPDKDCLMKVVSCDLHNGLCVAGNYGFGEIPNFIRVSRK